MTYRVTGQHELYVEWRGHVEFRMLKAPSGAHNYMRLYGLDPASKLVRPLLPAVKVLASSIAGEEEESVEDHEGLIPTPVQDRLFLTSDQAKEYLVAQMCANRVPVVQFGERIKIQAATLAQFKPADLRNVWGLRGRAMDDEPGCLPDGWKVDGRAYHSGALAVADVLAACKSLSGASVEKELLVNDVGVAQMPVCHSHTGGLVYAPGVDGRFGWRSPQSTDSIAIVLFLDNPSNPDDMTTMADGKTLAKPFQRLTRVMNTLPLDCRSRILVQHMVPVCSTKCTMQVSADCWRSVTSGNLALVQALRCTWVVAASKQVQAVFQRCDKICDSTLTDQHVAIQHRRYGGDTTDGGLDLDFNLIEIPHPSMPWHTRDIYAALATALCKLQAPAVEWDGRFPVDLATSCGSAFRHLRPITSVKCEGGPSRWVGISIREDHHLYQLGDTTLTGNSHPHIINFYHVWENKEKDQICFTTEIVTSGTLKQYTSRVKSIKLKVIKKVRTENTQRDTHTRAQCVVGMLICSSMFVLVLLPVVSSDPERSRLSAPPLSSHHPSRSQVRQHLHQWRHRRDSPGRLRALGASHMHARGLRAGYARIHGAGAVRRELLGERRYLLIWSAKYIPQATSRASVSKRTASVAASLTLASFSFPPSLSLFAFRHDCAGDDHEGVSLRRVFERGADLEEGDSGLEARCVESHP